MKNIWQKLVTNKKKLILGVIMVIVLFGSLLLTSRFVLAQSSSPTIIDPNNTNIVTTPGSAGTGGDPAPIEKFVLQALGTLASWIVEMLGKLLTVVIGILISIAQYNDFINSPVVEKGWMLIRDLCNMFFVVILIIMAFGTVFQKEQYSYKRLLSSMVFAAVLVNFSKAICGIIIDFSQVIMLTFFNAVKDAAAGNFAELIGLKNLIEITVSGHAGAPVNLLQTVIAYGLAVILLVVALVVFVVITIIILLRIIQLWFLVMLSPIAFLATVGIPRLSAYSSKWWDKFGNQVIIGPVLAIFLWLSLAVVANGSSSSALITGKKNGQTPATVDPTGNNKVTAAITDIGNSEGLLGFVVGIAMLVASLSMAQEMGVAGGALAGRAATGMKNFAQGASKGLARWTGGQADMRLRQLTGAGGRALGGTKFGQRLGLTKDFQGVGFRTIKQSFAHRKQLAEAEENRKIGISAQVMGQGLYQASHAGFWSKQVSQKVFGNKKAGDAAAAEAARLEQSIHKMEDQDKGPLGKLQKSIDKLSDTINNMEGQRELITSFLKDTKLQGELAVDPKKLQEKLLELRNQGLMDDDKQYQGYYTSATKDPSATLKAVMGDLALKNTQLRQDQATEMLKKRAEERDPKYKRLVAARDKAKTEMEAARNEAYKHYSANFFGKSLAGLGYPEKEDVMARVKLEKVNEKLNEMKDRLPEGDENAYIGELLKRIASKDGAGIEAALKLVYSVNGHNTLGANSSWHAMAEELLQKKYGADFAKIKPQFDSERSNHVFLRDTIDELMKSTGGYGDQESIRVVQQLANIGSEHGNHSMVGAVHTDSITGETTLVQAKKINISPSVIRMEAPDEWQNAVTTRNSQIEPQQWARGLHINTLAIQDAHGRATDFHETGYDFLLHNLTHALIKQFDRLRDDTRSHLWSLRTKVTDLVRSGQYKHADGRVEKLSAERIDILNKYLEKLRGLVVTGKM